MVRDVLGDTFQRAGLEVVAEADSAQEAVARAREAHPEIAVLDVAMPGDVLVAIRELKRLETPPKILVLTASDDEALSVRCMKAGADGFLRKTQAVDELLKAIERLRRGGKYVSPELAWLLVARGTEEMRPHENLSQRELQILLRLGAAETVTSIADDLGLSVKTVSTYRSRILEKMGFEKNADIIRYCLEHSLS
ncbi:MAG: response regulator transcription factor [Thermoanaerobaculia bacterium]|nr:response regulator transcription factor [Thermoanaerobaculia bacterium]